MSDSTMAAIIKLQKERDQLRDELRDSVTTKYHDEIVQCAIDENVKLRAENEALRAERDQLRAENKRLRVSGHTHIDLDVPPSF